MTKQNLKMVCDAAIAGGFIGLGAFIANRAFKNAKDNKEYARKQLERKEEIKAEQVKREQEIKLEELKGMTPEQKFALKEKELEVRKLEAEAKEKVENVKKEVTKEVIDTLEPKLTSIAHDEVCDIFKGFNKAKENTISPNISLDLGQLGNAVTTAMSKGNSK